MYKYLFLFCFCFLAFNKSSGQIVVSEVLQESKINFSKENKLYLIDFWATWCAPCIHVKTYLTTLQKKFPTDLYIISVSEENSEIIKHFLEKKPTDLSIAVDNYSELFKKYNIKELPNAILFNANGEILWRGHPSDLKEIMIKTYLTTENILSSKENFIKIKEENFEQVIEYLPKNEIEIEEVTKKYENLVIDDHSNYLKIEGSLVSIISHLFKIYEEQLILPENFNSYYKIYFKKPVTNYEDIGKKLIKKLGYKILVEETEGLAYTLEINNLNFWDTNQINWGGENQYLINEYEIIGDNVNLKELIYELSKAIESPIIILDENANYYKEHDWQIHYKYYEFMVNNLLDYGIEIKKDEITYPIYVINKNTP